MNKNKYKSKNKKGKFGEKFEDDKNCENEKENDNYSENENEKENVNETDNNNNKLKKKNFKGSSKKNINARNRLLKSIGRNYLINEEDDDYEEKKDGKENKKNEKLKTEYDQDINNKIKSKLRKIAKGEDNSESFGIFNKNKKYNNTIISSDSGLNNLIKSHNPNNADILRIKSKSKKYTSKDKNNNKHNKNDSSKEINSNRRMVNFEEEGEIKGNMGIPITDEEILKKKKSNNNDDNISDLISFDKNIIVNKKSEYEMFKEKILSSSVSAFLESEGDKPILVEEKFFLYYWRYFNRREICLVSFRDKYEAIPYFVRWSSFVFCLILA